MAATNKDNDKKTMDISKPGKSAPDSSSRPVLVTHRPMVQDPMVNSTPTEEEPNTDEQKKDTVSHTTKVLQPVDTSLKAEDAEDTEDPKPAEDEDTKSEESAVVDAVVEQADTKSKKKENGLNEEDKTKQEHIKKLIEEKTYFVPIGQAAQRRNRRAAVGLIVLLLVVIGVYAAVDAGVILPNVQLPLDLIKN